MAAFFEKLAHFLAFVVKVGVVTAEASQSGKLREWDGIFGIYCNVRSMFIRKYLFSWRHLELNSFLLLWLHALSVLIMCSFSVRQRLHRLEILF